MRNLFIGEEGNIIEKKFIEVIKNPFYCKILIIVPNNPYIKPYLKYLIEKYNLNNSINIYSILELAEMLFFNINVNHSFNTTFLVNKYIRESIIKKIIEEEKEENINYKGISNNIKELKENLIFFDKLELIGNKHNIKKFLILSKIYYKFQSLINRKGLKEEEDIILEASKKIWHYKLLYNCIIIYGFNHFTIAELKFFKELFASQWKDIFFFLDLEIFYYYRYFLNFIITRDFKTEILLDNKEENKKRELKFYSFFNNIEEINFIIENYILKLIHEKKRIGIICSNKKYKNRICKILYENRIINQYSEKFINYKEGKLLNLILEFLNDPKLNTILDIASYNNYILNINKIFQEEENKNFILNTIKDRGFHYILHEWERIKKELNLPYSLNKSTEVIKGYINILIEKKEENELLLTKSLLNYINYWERIYFYFEKIENPFNFLKNIILFYEKICKENIISINIKKEIKKILWLTYENNFYTKKDILDIIKEVLNSQELELNQINLNLIIDTPQNISGVNFDYIFFIGMIEEIENSEDNISFLNDKEKFLIEKEVKICKLDIYKKNIWYEKLFYTLIQHSYYPAIFSFYRYSINNSNIFISNILIDIISKYLKKTISISNPYEEDLIQFIPQNYYIYFPPLSNSDFFSIPINSLFFILNFYKKNKENKKIYNEILLLTNYMVKEAYKRLNKWLSEKNITIFDGLIYESNSNSSDSVIKDYLKEFLKKFSNEISAEALETYSICPYRFFIKYVLNLDKNKKSLNFFSTSLYLKKEMLLDTISYYAEKKIENIEEFYKRIEEYKLKIKYYNPQIEDLIIETEQEKVLDVLFLYLGIEEKYLEENGIITNHNKIIDNNIIRFFKIKYNKKKSQNYPFLKLEIDENIIEIALNGTIDHIKIDEKNKRVQGINYLFKEKKEKKGNKLYGGEQLELPLNLFALYFLFPNYENYSSLYYLLTSKNFGKKIICDLDKEKLINLLKIIITNVIKSIKNGYFLPSINSSKCYSCQYKNICQILFNEIIEIKLNLNSDFSKYYKKIKSLK